MCLLVFNGMFFGSGGCGGGGAHDDERERKEIERRVPNDGVKD